MDPLSIFASAGTGLVNTFNNMMNNQNSQEMQQQAEQFNQAMVTQQENFQERMSNTAYQRASADMQAAGLNPMMMFGSGSAASTPAGASTSIAPAQKTSLLSGLPQAIQTAVQSASGLRTANATIDNLVEENARIKAQTATELAKPALVQSQKENVDEDTQNKFRNRGLITAKAANEAADLPTHQNVARTGQNLLDMDPAVRRTLDVLGFGGKKIDEIISPATNIVSSAAGAKRAFAPVAARWPD